MVLLRSSLDPACPDKVLEQELTISDSHDYAAGLDSPRVSTLHCGREYLSVRVAKGGILSPC
jgi:hypothetical protein